MTSISDDRAATATANGPRALMVRVEQGIAIITIDLPGKAVNTLSSAISGEFADVFARVERDSSIVAAVLLSGKPESFIVGADIDELSQLQSSDAVQQLSRSGQRMLDKMAAFPKPIVAAIHGACLGGGLEVALACQWRVLSDHPKSVCALPEVQLGLIPGAGGTQRLPRLIGLTAALDMILTGRTVKPKQAKSRGLVDDLVHPAILLSVATQRARELATRTRTRKRRALNARAFLLEENPLGRAVVLRKAREQLLARTKGFYPAPLAALDVIAEGFRNGMTQGLAAEAARFGELAMTAESRELVYLFQATTQLKKDSGVPELGDESPSVVTRLGVVGAGFMGAGIATVACQQSVQVRFRDETLERVASGVRAVAGVLREKRNKRRMTALAMSDALSLVSGGTDYTGFRRAELVIEAVFEELAVKHQVLHDVEAQAPNAIFASNTSTIPITEIASAAAHPERVLGMHFFSPVHKMPLLEVIVTERTSAAVTAQAVAFGKQIGKTVIVVRDGPGFYVNRILAPYISEAGRLLDEGVDIASIDAALTAYGFPVGPITLLDEVGLDIAAKSGGVMEKAFGDRLMPSVTLQRVLASGRTGRKGGGGFYRYDAEGKRIGVDEAIYEMTTVTGPRQTVSAQEIQTRTVLAMLNEAVRCLDEGVLQCARDGDIGAVFGIGFPPFRGGPFRTIDARGARSVVQELAALDARFPGRFDAAPLLREYAQRDGRFHPLAQR